MERVHKSRPDAPMSEGSIKRPKGKVSEDGRNSARGPGAAAAASGADAGRGQHELQDIRENRSAERFKKGTRLSIL